MKRDEKKRNMSRQIIIATALGILLGLIFKDKLLFLRFIGDIFLRLIQMSIVLLVLGHIIEAVGSINPGKVGKLGAMTFAIFMISSVLASTWGVFMGLVFSPGSGVDISAMSDVRAVEAASMGSLTETIVSFVPTNVVGSMANNTIIHVLLFGMFFGIAAAYVADAQGNTRLLEMTSLFNKTIVKMISGIMVIAPAAICVIMATTIGQLGLQIMVPLARYLGVYALATLIFLIVWQIVVCVFCRVGFVQLTKNMGRMSLVALATTSSAITLPTAMEDSIEKLGIGRRITNLVLPLGMSLNSNGAAMHMAITIITIKQIYNVHYGAGHLFYIVALTTLASLANAVVPGAGLVSLTMVIPAMGLPMESIVLFAGVDWFVGMLRTILNVNADVFSALLVAEVEGEIDHSVFNSAH